MVVGFHKLDAAVFGGEELFNGCTGLVVCDVEGRCVTLICECGVDLFECFEDGRVSGGSNRDCKDVVRIIVVCDEEVLFAVDRASRKGTRAICVECASLLICKGGVTENV